MFAAGYLVRGYRGQIPITEGPVAYLAHQRLNQRIESKRDDNSNAPMRYGRLYDNYLVCTSGGGRKVVIPVHALAEVVFAE